MTEEDGKKYIIFFEKTRKNKDESVAQMGELIILNLGHLRSFTSTFLTINITFLGALLTLIATKGDIILESRAIKASLALLFLNVILISFYQITVLIGENLRLNQIQKFFKNSHDQSIKKL